MKTRLQRLSPHLQVALLVTMIAAVVGARTGGIWTHVTSPDLHALFLPKFQAAARAILYERRLPLWNPFEYCGLPFLANSQAAALYPPVWLCFGIFSSFTALQVFYLLHVALLSGAASVYWRREGASTAAIVVGLLVTLHGLGTGLYSQAVDHPAFLAYLAWLPVALLCAEHCLAARSALAFGGLAVITAVQWFIGYPELVLDGCVLMAVVIACTPIATLPIRLAVLVAAVVLGTALAALQLVPLHEAVGESARMDQESFWVVTRGLQGITAGKVRAGQWHWIAVGAALFAVLTPSRRRRGWALAWAVTLFALDPPLAWMYHFPPFAQVRVPFGWSHLGPFFLGGLVAAGVTSLRARFGAVAAVTLSVVVGVQAIHGFANSLTPWPFLTGRPNQGESIEERRALFASARVLGPFPGRWISSEGSHLGVALPNQMSFLTGWEPTLQPRWLEALLSHTIEWKAPELALGPSLVEQLTRRPKLFELLGVAYVVVPRTLADQLLAMGFIRLRGVPPSDVLLYRPPLPRARIVYDVTVEPDERRVLAAIADPAHDARRGAYVGAPLNERIGPAGYISRARLIRYLPEQVTVKATVNSPGLLVLADTYFPGWIATRDGTPVDIVRVDQLFRGVHLPAGRHVVRFSYQPQSVRIGAAVSGLAAMLLFGVIGFGVRRR